MDAFERLVEGVVQAAPKFGMEASVVGGISWVPGSNGRDGYEEDGRLLKIFPSGVPTCLLLEVEFSNGLRLYSHREPALTREFKGRTVTAEWVLAFMAANKDLAVSIKNRPRPAQAEPRRGSPITPYSAEEIAALRAERHTVTCSCRGVAENCRICFGSGTYAADGFGNRL
jgi:hypothetical protein